jgi:hypothetical protein
MEVLYQLSYIGNTAVVKRAEDETRTRDPQLGRLMLYQLSYFRIVVLLVGVVGFEPTQPKQQIYSLPRLSNFGAPPAFFNRYRAGGGIRTPDPLITNQLLWPTELHWHYR